MGDLKMRFIDDLDIKGKRLLIRVDYNVPIKRGVISDDIRITSSLPTLQYALDNGASIILCAHLGKPKGQVRPELTLMPVAVRLGEILGRPVGFAPDCIGPEVKQMAEAMNPGDIMMLQNLRFHPEEIAKDEAGRGDMGKQLAELADVYVNDAFGVAHRTNASVVDVPKYARESCGGLLLKKELAYLGDALAKPERPFLCVSGGAKVSTKMGILHNLLGKVDDIIIGGAMANTFMLAKGYSVGKSLAEPDQVEKAKATMNEAEAKGTTLHLPVDYRWATSIDDTEVKGICAADAIPEEAITLDIGPETTKIFESVIAISRTVVWNGPMGMFENPAFGQGSMAMCEAIATLDGALTIVGGGDTNAMIKANDLADSFSFISTGGGSFMEFLEGKELPAFKALKEYGS